MTTASSDPRRPLRPQIVVEAKVASSANPLVVLLGGPATVVANAYLSDPSIADSFSIFDMAGGNLPINEFKGGSRRTLFRQPLHSGKSGTVVAPETATKIVLFKDGKKVDEWDINLVVGQVNELRR